MSRIGRLPIPVPKNVNVTVQNGVVTVKGPKGELERQVPPDMEVTIVETEVLVKRPSDIGRHRSLHGLTRALIHNMVHGVSEGFSKQLEIRGVGYKAETSKDGVRLVVGYSHPVDYTAPPGITISLESPTVVNVHGIDKQVVGQVAAELRSVRPPEPYKGKGIRYMGEHVRQKAGKTGAK